MAKRRIYRDPIQPREERGLPLKSVDRSKCFNESILSKIRCIFPIGGHVVDHAVDPFPVSYHELVEGRDFSLLHPLHDRPIAISLLATLIRAHQGFAEDFGHNRHTPER